MALIAALWYLVIVAQGKTLAGITADCARMRTKLGAASDKVRRADQVSHEWTNSMEKLAQREATFAPAREPYSWMGAVLRHFAAPAEDIHRYKSITNLDFKPPEISDKGVIGGFPYKWARFHITGEGHYHDFGKFLANFENAFPYFSLQNLDVFVPDIRQTQDPDMLAYSFDIVTPQLSSGAETK